MHVKQQVTQAVEVARVVRLGHVLRNHHRHVRVIVEARVKAHVLVHVLTKPIEPNGVVKVIEALSHRDGCGGEHHALHLGQPALAQVGTNVELLCQQLFGRHVLLAARHLRGVHVRLVRALHNQSQAVLELAQKAAGFVQVRAKLWCDLVEFLDRGAHVLLGLFKLVRRCVPRLGKRRPLRRGARLLIKPHRKVVVSATRSRDLRKVVERNKHVRH